MSIVLLVEDDPTLVMVIEAALADRGLQVLTAAGDKAAQRILEREAPHIGVLIADVHLGSAATGFDVSRRARRLNPRMEVVYITGRSLDVDKFGVHGGVLLPKPFDVEALGDMVVALASDPV
jgi:DNA-binding response OmpR family regulator